MSKLAGYDGHFSCLSVVISAEAGIQSFKIFLDPRLHGDDRLGVKDKRALGVDCGVDVRIKSQKSYARLAVRGLVVE